jgi:hypothetical protein
MLLLLLHNAVATVKASILQGFFLVVAADLAAVAAQ